MHTWEKLFSSKEMRKKKKIILKIVFGKKKCQVFHFYLLSENKTFTLKRNKHQRKLFSTIVVVERIMMKK